MHAQEIAARRESHGNRKAGVIIVRLENGNGEHGIPGRDSPVNGGRCTISQWTYEKRRRERRTRAMYTYLCVYTGSRDRKRITKRKFVSHAARIIRQTPYDFSIISPNDGTIIITRRVFQSNRCENITL